MTRATACELVERTARGCGVGSTNDAVDDASTVDARGRRKFFGERLEGWSTLDAGGEIRASFRAVAREGVESSMRAEVWFECDVAMARSRARVYAERAERDAEATTREAADENGERAVEVTCSFDGVDVDSVVRHDALNVGAFVVALKTGTGEEIARAALLTRVEQDDKGTLRRLVLPFEARFDDETEGEMTPS